MLEAYVHWKSQQKRAERLPKTSKSDIGKSESKQAYSSHIAKKDSVRADQTQAQGHVKSYEQQANRNSLNANYKNAVHSLINIHQLYLQHIGHTHRQYLQLSANSPIRSR